MEDIEYLDEYEDLILLLVGGGGGGDNNESAGIVASDDSSTYDHIFERLFDDHSDTESVVQKKIEHKLNEQKDTQRISLDSVDLLVRDLNRNETMSQTAKHLNPLDSVPTQDASSTTTNLKTAGIEEKSKAQSAIANSTSRYLSPPTAAGDSKKTQEKLKILGTTRKADSTSKSSLKSVFPQTTTSPATNHSYTINDKSINKISDSTITSTASSSKKIVHRPQPTIIKPIKPPNRDPVEDPLRIDPLLLDSNLPNLLPSTSEVSSVTVVEQSKDMDKTTNKVENTVAQAAIVTGIGSDIRDKSELKTTDNTDNKPNIIKIKEKSNLQTNSLTAELQSVIANSTGEKVLSTIEKPPAKKRGRPRKIRPPEMDSSIPKSASNKRRKKSHEDSSTEKITTKTVTAFTTTTRPYVIQKQSAFLIEKGLKKPETPKLSVPLGETTPSALSPLSVTTAKANKKNVIRTDGRKGLKKQSLNKSLPPAAIPIFKSSVTVNKKKSDDKPGVTDFEGATKKSPSAVITFTEWLQDHHSTKQKTKFKKSDLKEITKTLETDKTVNNKSKETEPLEMVDEQNNLTVQGDMKSAEPLSPAKSSPSTNPNIVKIVTRKRRKRKNVMPSELQEKNTEENKIRERQGNSPHLTLPKKPITTEEMKKNVSASNEDLTKQNTMPLHAKGRKPKSKTLKVTTKFVKVRLNRRIVSNYLRDRQLLVVVGKESQVLPLPTESKVNHTPPVPPSVNAGTSACDESSASQQLTQSQSDGTAETQNTSNSGEHLLNNTTTTTNIEDTHSETSIQKVIKINEPKTTTAKKKVAQQPTELYATAINSFATAINSSATATTPKAKHMPTSKQSSIDKQKQVTGAAVKVRKLKTSISTPPSIGLSALKGNQHLSTKKGNKYATLKLKEEVECANEQNVVNSASALDLLNSDSGFSIPAPIINKEGTRLYSFLHPSQYIPKQHGNVPLDCCCPNLNGSLSAIDPTRIHSQLQATVRELPAYIVMTTKVMTRADVEADKNAVPASLRQKMDEITASTAKTSTRNPLMNVKQHAQLKPQATVPPPKDAPVKVSNAKSSLNRKSNETATSVEHREATTDLDRVIARMHRYDNLLRVQSSQMPNLSALERQQYIREFVNSNKVTAKGVDAAFHLLTNYTNFIRDKCDNRSKM